MQKILKFNFLQMDNEWSMDFAFPLLSLLRTNGSVEAAKEKAKNICEDNELLDACLRSCSITLERKILRLGLQPWRHLCRRLECKWICRHTFKFYKNDVYFQYS